MSEATETGEVITEEPQISEYEQTARDQGWKPKEEFISEGGDENKWVDFGEFNRRKELFDAIHEARKEAKTAKKQAEALAKINTNIEAQAYERARRDLLNERREAARNNDLEGVVTADEKLAALAAPKSIRSTAAIPPEMENFISENKWYAEDDTLQAFANGIGAKLEREDPDMDKTELLRKVKEATVAAFPEKFKRNTGRGPSVLPSRTGPSGPVGRDDTKKITYRDLPDEAKRMYNLLVKSERNPRGLMTGEDYLSQYAAYGSKKEE